jgi:hypothetical protein
MDYIVFKFKGKELKRIVDDGVCIDEVMDLKKDIAEWLKISPDDICVDVEETHSEEAYDFYVSVQGKLMFRGISYDREMDGVRIAIDIFKEEGLNNFLDQFKGDVMQILSLKMTLGFPSDYGVGQNNRDDFFCDDF